MRILIVEDDLTFRKSLRDLLSEKFPHTIIEEAWDGEMALKQVDAFRPELVLMDIQMPKENGLAATKKIKAASPQIVVIILTNYDLPEYQEAANQYGADGFLTKDVSTGEIVESISRYLPDS